MCINLNYFTTLTYHLIFVHSLLRRIFKATLPYVALCCLMLPYVALCCLSFVFVGLADLTARGVTSLFRKPKKRTRA